VVTRVFELAQIFRAANIGAVALFKKNAFKDAFKILLGAKSATAPMFAVPNAWANSKTCLL